jgi:hypothetical protein
MIKATELRLGNLVDAVGVGECRLSVIEKDKEYKDLFSILLTEEFMRQKGFSTTSSHVGYHEYRVGSLRLLINKGDKEVSACNSKGFLCNIKSAHQLQNLYFALNNEELVFKSDTIQ